MIDDEQLASMLLDAELIERDRLARAMGMAEEKEAPLYDVLIRGEWIAERRVVEIASRLLNVPCVHLDETDLDDDTLKMISGEMAADNQVVPVELLEEDGARVLKLAMVDPIDVMAMDEISTHTEVDIRPVLAGPVDLEAAIESVYFAEDVVDLGSVEDDEEILELDLDDEQKVDLGAGVELEDGDSNQEIADDSWAEMFDDGEADEDEEGDELELELELADDGDPDTGVLSQEMRDRPTTGAVILPDEDEEDSKQTAGPAFSKHPAMMSDTDTSSTHVASPGQLAGFELDEALEDSSTGDDSDHNATSLGASGKSGEWDELDDDFYADGESSSAADRSDSPDSPDSSAPPSAEDARDGNEDDSESHIPRSLRSAIEKAKDSAKKAKKPKEKAPDPVENSTDDESSSSDEKKPRSEQSTEDKRAVSSLGRIDVKKKKVPRSKFKGAIEKRSDREEEEKRRHDRHTPRQLKSPAAEASAGETVEADVVEDLAELEADKTARSSEPSEPSEPLDPATRQVAVSDLAEDSMLAAELGSDESKTGFELPDGIDARRAFAGLVELLVDRQVLERDDIEQLLDRLRDDG